ncbi:MAG: hypothetical protein ACJAYJ_000173 [Saprospiraceae bacterium]|jgi:hypothetical protein
MKTFLRFDKGSLRDKSGLQKPLLSLKLRLAAGEADSFF